MLLGISVIKNEADIVEVMARRNLQFLDHLHIIDNGSTDGTYEVVAALKEEGLSITLRRDARFGHLQTQMINDCLAKEVAIHNPLQVVPLDGDELLCGDPKAFRLECANTDTPLRLDWKTYVPTAKDDETLINPIQRIRYRRTLENPQYSKCTIPGSLLGTVTLDPGSHSVRQLNGRRVAMRRSDSAYIAHFPVRNIAQITAKALLGHWNLALRAAKRSEGYQWHKIAHEILKTGEMSHETFLEFGETYASHQKQALIEDPVWPDAPDVRYTRLLTGSAVPNIAAYTEALVDEIAGEVYRSRRPTPPLPRPSTIVKTVIRGQPVDFCVTHPRDVIQKHHSVGSFYEEEELAIISKYFPIGGTFVDIGANVGNHSIYCGLFLKPSRIILAEPNPAAIKVLEANISLNDLDQICDVSKLGAGIGAANARGGGHQ